MKAISIEQLAEKLNGKLWTKGDLKRIYLDEGYNTKKMTTKTFVWQDENGDFKVSCRVDCPSQPRQWEQSQEDEIKDRVYGEIKNALSDTVYILTDENGKMVNWKKEEVALNDSTYTYTEDEARKEIDNCTYFTKFITMPRDEFEKEVERLDEIDANLTDAQRIELGQEISYGIYKKNREATTQKVMEKLAEFEQAGLDVTCSMHQDTNYDASGSFKKRVEGQETARIIIERRIDEVKSLLSSIKTTYTSESTTDLIAGDRVNHDRFGLGTVQEKDSLTITVNFDQHGQKKLIIKFAKLTKFEQ